MRKTFAATLALVIMMFGLFTGCEPAPSIPSIVTTMKGYNDELIGLLLPPINGTSPLDFPEDTVITIDDGIDCKVRYSDSGELDLLLRLNFWVAHDGTEICGILPVDIEYYSSSSSIYSFQARSAMLYFDRTSVSYRADVTDGDETTEAFTPDTDYFTCTSLIVDGKTLLANVYESK